MRVFIGGIMQGSRLDRFIDNQDYRSAIAETILNHHPDVEIIDPNLLHPNGVDYDDAEAKETLLQLFAVARQADMIVAYAPQASMGTAIEIWQGFQSGAPIVSISPMEANWVIRHLSTVVLPDLDAFRQWIVGGGLDKLANLD